MLDRMSQMLQKWALWLTCWLFSTLVGEFKQSCKYFTKVPDIKYLQLCKPYALVQLLNCAVVAWRTISARTDTWLCLNEILLTAIGSRVIACQCLISSRKYFQHTRNRLPTSKDTGQTLGSGRPCTEQPYPLTQMCCLILYHNLLLSGSGTYGGVMDCI